MPIRSRLRFSAEKAHAAQMQLSKWVIREDTLPEPLNYVAGVDVAYAKEVSVGAVAVLDFASLSLIEARVACVKTKFPYIPTLLSYREIPPALSAIKKLRIRPDVFLVDGQGIAHPYRFGFASHLGLVVDAPTVGVAKSLLSGEVGSFNDRIWAPVIDGEEIVGAAVISKPECKPIFVSVGHRISLKRAINIVTHCTRFHRVPEPIRKAHMLASEEKKKLMQKPYQII